jgi:hypothetical protein
MMDLNDEYPNQWMPLIYTTGDQELFAKKYEIPSVGNVIHFLTLILKIQILFFMHFNCKGKRTNNKRKYFYYNVGSLNEFYLEVKLIRNDYLKLPPDDISLTTPFTSYSGKNLSEFFRLIRNKCQMFNGTTDSTINHDDVWHFAMIGRNLERADKTTRILDMKYFILLPSVHDVGSTLDLLQWISLLKSASAHEMYNRIFPKVVPLHIAEFMIQNPVFPRSIKFCLEGIDKNVMRVSSGDSKETVNIAHESVLRALKKIDSTTMSLVFKDGFHEYIDQIQIHLNEIGESIHERFFRI